VDVELSTGATEVNILSIDWWSFDEALGAVRVRAMVEGIVPLRRAGDEPEELGEAMCMAQVLVEPGEWPEDPEAQRNWLEDYQPEWFPMDDSGW
jgi:hypothetical protein